jgi:3-methylornithyl-N6-L-lysine dehydrogenase
MNMAERLTQEEVREVMRKLPEYDAELVRKTGWSLRQIAERAGKAGEPISSGATGSRRAAVVRITSGQGVIEGFAEAVQAILVHVGAEAFITRATDVAGLAEAVERKAHIVFLADDDRFIALNLALRRIADNAEATARGYVSALETMAGGLAGRQVLVIGGAGRVGWNAVLALKEKQAAVAVFDPDKDRLQWLAGRQEIAVKEDLEQALGESDLLFDASPATGIIQGRHIKPGMRIAAPGIPLGLTEEACSAAGDHLIHDALEIGVATMLFHAGSVQPGMAKAGG